MKVMVLVKATKASEAGELPSTELLTAMGHYNEELAKAGVLVGGEGLKPSAEGKRVSFGADGPQVVAGPFAETEQLVAGFWLWEVPSMDAAVEWARRCPDPMPGEQAQLELRPVFGSEDFGDAMTDELRDKEARLREAVEGV